MAVNLLFITTPIIPDLSTILIIKSFESNCSRVLNLVRIHLQM